MKAVVLILLLLGGGLSRSFAQLNVELLHQLVAENQDEEKKQNTARDRQAVASANEEVNRSEMDKLKSKYRQLQNRFQMMGLVISAAQIGIEAAPIIQEIIAQQERIINRASQFPELVPMAANAERDLVDQANLLGRYLAGLLISIGDINQMKASDRKMLFGHVVTELRTLAGACRGLANILDNYQRPGSLNALNPFAGFIDQNKQLVQDILNQAKGLHP